MANVASKSRPGRVSFLCNHCGSVHPKWMGKCPDCGTWDSLSEYREPTPDGRRPTGSATGAGEAYARQPVRAVRLADATDEDGLGPAERLHTGIGEFDRVLGGGIVRGSATLVGGEPGIGKSTLLLQVARSLASAAASDGASAGAGEATRTKPTSHAHAITVLYVTSEESVRQTRLRADRLTPPKASNGPDDGQNLLILAETNLERILDEAIRTRADVLVIDSIQMVYKPSIPAAPGSVTQLRDCCTDLVYFAKGRGVSVLLVGHVTKAGTLAGPKLIEHVVDTVVYFDGDRFHAHRIVRCSKNRFGSTTELGLFEMTGAGMRPVEDPGTLFLQGHPSDREPPPSGSVLTATMQGTRVLLVEVQALTAPGVLGSVKRKVSGVSADRVAMILAVLEKRADLRLATEDVFVNVVGGVKLAEPSADLAVALAIASAHQNRPLGVGTVALGELGLSGEVRPVGQVQTRLREAARLGAGHAIVPAVRGSSDDVPRLGGMSVRPVRRLQQALAAL